MISRLRGTLAEASFTEALVECAGFAGSAWYDIGKQMFAWSRYLIDKDFQFVLVSFNAEVVVYPPFEIIGQRKLFFGFLPILHDGEIPYMA